MVNRVQVIKYGGVKIKITEVPGAQIAEYTLGGVLYTKRFPFRDFDNAYRSLLYYCCDHVDSVPFGKR